MKHLSEEQQRLGVRIHAASYFVIMLVLVAVNFWTGRPYWVVWVLPGWSIGLLCHWYFTLGRGFRRA